MVNRPPPTPRAWIVSRPFFFARIPAWCEVPGACAAGATAPRCAKSAGFPYGRHERAAPPTSACKPRFAVCAGVHGAVGCPVITGVAQRSQSNLPFDVDPGAEAAGPCIAHRRWSIIRRCGSIGQTWQTELNVGKGKAMADAEGKILTLDEVAASIEKNPKQGNREARHYRRHQ